MTQFENINQDVLGIICENLTMKDIFVGICLTCHYFNDVVRNGSGLIKTIEQQVGKSPKYDYVRKRLKIKLRTNRDVILFYFFNLFKICLVFANTINKNFLVKSVIFGSKVMDQKEKFFYNLIMLVLMFV